MILYNLCSTETLHEYQITKFDSDFNVESSYTVSESGCDCPQAHKPTCRHRRMLPLFLATDRIDTNWFLKFEDSTWHQIGQASEIDTQVREALDEPPITRPESPTNQSDFALPEALAEDVGAVPYLPKAPESPIPTSPKINRRI